MNIHTFPNSSFSSFPSLPNPGETYPAIGQDLQLGPEFDLIPNVLHDPCNTQTNATAPEQVQQNDLSAINQDFASSFDTPTFPTVPDPAQFFESAGPQTNFLSVPQIDFPDHLSKDLFPHPSVLQAALNTFEPSPAASTANTTIPLQTAYHDILSSTFNLNDADQSLLATPSQQTACTNNTGQQPSANNPSIARSADKRTDTKGARSGRKRTRTRTEDMDPSLVHTCPTCGKKFAKKYNQKIHQRRHQGDLPFVCEYDGCGKGFMWRSSFLRHLRVHEDSSDRPRKAARKSPNDGNPAHANSVDVMQVSERTSIMLLNGMKLDIDHFGLESIRMASALCTLNGSSCQQIMDMDLNIIRQTDEQVISKRSHQVKALRSTPLDLSNSQVAQIHSLLMKSAVV